MKDLQMKIRRVMRRRIKTLFRRLGITFERPRSGRPNNIGKVATLRHENAYKGNVLLSYVIEPFLLRPGEAVSVSHHHDWLSWQIARTFSGLGYDVDVIDYRDGEFMPRKKYDYLVGARTNFQRLARLTGDDCVKILHLDTAHWIFNNAAAYRRHLDLQLRRHVSLHSLKWVEPNWAIECADYTTTNWGNQFNVGTYAYAGKPVFQIPLPACAVYPWPEDKDFEACRSRFVWFGSAGLVHKGLDLVLEAFAKTPECSLTVCGPLRKKGQNSMDGELQCDHKFEEAFSRELYDTPNIGTAGWIDITSPEFLEICNQSIGVVFPSCAEGGGASVVTCMQAGLVPIVSYESNVEVEDFGVTLKTNTIEDIEEAIRELSKRPVKELTARARKTWEFARAHHTREKFTEIYGKVITQIMDDSEKP